MVFNKHYISHELAVALINVDDSGLTDNEIKLSEEWNKKVGWVYMGDNSEIVHEYCEITGLMSQCTEVKTIA